MSLDGPMKIVVIHEVHVFEFKSRENFINYRSDPALLSLAGLREQAIKSTNIYSAGEYVSYEQY